MRDIVILFLHLIVTWMQLARPGSIRSVVAEYVLVKHQALILNRSRKRAPNLRASDRIIAGLCALLMRPARVVRSAIGYPTWGCRRIAQQITLAFGIQINKDVVRRILWLALPTGPRFGWPILAQLHRPTEGHRRQRHCP